MSDCLFLTVDSKNNPVINPAIKNIVIFSSLPAIYPASWLAARFITTLSSAFELVNYRAAIALDAQPRQTGNKKTRNVSRGGVGRFEGGG